jgi:threonine/homoserine/homoserine lactone efflux protein
MFTVSTGLFQGWRASIAAACGCTACITDIPYPIPGRGEKMPKSVMFIIFIAVIILAGFLAYTQVQMLQ